MLSLVSSYCKCTGAKPHSCSGEWSACSTLPFVGGGIVSLEDVRPVFSRRDCDSSIDERIDRNLDSAFRGGEGKGAKSRRVNGDNVGWA